MKEEVIEIFRTNIHSRKSADLVIGRLSDAFPTMQFNIDLHDSDKILRVKGESSRKREVQGLTNFLGYTCEEIE